MRTGLRQLQQLRRCGVSTSLLCTTRAAAFSSSTTPPGSSSSSSSSTTTPVGAASRSTAGDEHAATLPSPPSSSSIAERMASSSQQPERASGTEGGRTPRPSPRAGASAIGKSKHGSGGGANTQLKVKKKAPWGVQQLRDSWSEDAMSKRDRENMDERIHREYRYHPEEFRRRYLRYTVILTIPCILVGLSITYYRETGRGIWTADPQHVLNLLRVMDTSPRSRLYAYRMEEAEVLPRHVRDYRAAHSERRAYDERIFRLTHSAFERPSEDALRQLEMDEQLAAQQAAASVASEAVEGA